MKRAPKLTIATVYARCSRQGECRLWKGAANGCGFPAIYDPTRPARNRTGRNVAGRTAVWTLAHGKPPADRRIIMSCHNTLCLRLEHMQLATFSEVMHHAVARGVMTIQRRVAITAANRRRRALTDEQAAEVVTRSRAGESRKDLAAAFNVGKTVIASTIRGERDRRFTPVANCSVFHMAA
jgi:hypothetical protein